MSDIKTAGAARIASNSYPTTIVVAGRSALEALPIEED